ncbi:hypothetical protein A3L11_02850 [Thermococcus siculi]|uniref:Uncharacterized protein n=2 Tax=Thermococcus siculi TaxID=72803 RepID=A0A2Z2MLC9_9EURY|nr:hypothetical protein [Thermococcus siculi]ASJ08221.1 hypothetical protein A3L11_02850 [Thermococcus siculi]
MEEVMELKDVLEKVEGKLIAAGKMYGAMNFAVWLVIMLFYYVLMGLFDLSWKFGLVYWPLAFIVAMVFTGRIWRMFKRLGRVTGEELGLSSGGGVLVGLSWMVGMIVGWVIVPRMGLGVTDEASVAMGFLTFIGISVLGMWLVFARYGGMEREMIPAFLLPLTGVPAAMKMVDGSLLWASFLVALGFSATVLWYLYSAFRAIER